VPYSFSQESGVRDKIEPFIDAVAAISLESRVVVPAHLEPFVIE
jgi:hypothetical protein